MPTARERLGVQYRAGSRRGESVYCLESVLGLLEVELHVHLPV